MAGAVKIFDGRSPIGTPHTYLKFLVFIDATRAAKISDGPPYIPYTIAAR